MTTNNPEQPYNPEQDSSREVDFKTEYEKALELQGLQLAAQIKDLRAVAKTEADFKLIQAKIVELTNLFELEPKLEKRETTPDRAREIMGKDFFGIKEFCKTFGLIKALPEEFKNVPYSEADLEQAKKLGEMLVLRYPMSESMKEISERLEQVFTNEDGSVLEDIDQYKNQSFFLEDYSIRPGWALVSKDVIKNSTAKDYLDQTIELYDYLSKTNSLTKEEENSIRPIGTISEIRELIKNNDYIAASERLSQMKINQNHRRNPAEALYDCAIQYKNTGQRTLSFFREYTNTCSSDGRLISFGHADAKGAIVDMFKPGHWSSNLGVVAVR